MTRLLILAMIAIVTVGAVGCRGASRFWTRGGSCETAIPTTGEPIYGEEMLPAAPPTIIPGPVTTTN